MLAAAIFAASIAMGVLAPASEGNETFKRLAEMLRPLAELGPLQLFLLIFVNNASKALFIILLGFLMGLPALLFLAFNGFLVGAVVSTLQESIGLNAVLAGLLPHGVIEVPALLLAAAMALAIGRESLIWLAGGKRKSQVKARTMRGLKVYLRWALPGLLIAAAIEAFVTPAVTRLTGA